MYIHGEMLPTDAYPGMKKYKHFLPHNPMGQFVVLSFSGAVNY